MDLSIVRDVVNAIHETEASGMLIENPELTGFSGKKLIGLLQRLAALASSRNECYLEVGVFQGLTLLSVATAMESGTAFGIDNFSHHDPEGANLSIVKERIDMLGATNAVVINEDYEDALEQLDKYIGDKKIGVYFIDGPHDYRSQFMCLALAKPYLSENAVVIVDDANYRHVRQANRDFLVTNRDFNLLFEAYTQCHPVNMTKQDKENASNGWWDGVNVLVRNADVELEPMYPPTLRNRLLYENDQHIHTARAAVCAPQLVALVSSVLSLNLVRAVVNLTRLTMQLFSTPSEYKGKYRRANTFSDELPTEHYNPSITLKQ
jgi:predicted O-methyltransferase YrrM